MFKQLRNEKGVTIVETIIVLAIMALIVALIVPTAVEGLAKAKADGFRNEFPSMISSVVSIKSSGGSATHALKLDVTDGSGNTILKDYIIQTAPSAAFDTITNSVPLKDASALTFTYGLNSITVSGSYTGTARHTGNLNTTPVAFGTPITALGLSTQGATGIAPIFNVNEEKLLSDFIESPNGLDWAEYMSTLQAAGLTSRQILAALFGGSEDGSNLAATYNPYLPNSPTNIGRSPIELTLLDSEAVRNSSSGSTIRTLTDASKGATYVVTGLVSRQEFVAYVANDDSIDGATVAVFNITSDIANKLYDRLERGFTVDTPVYIPYRERDIVKSVESDLKYGYYRP